MIDYRYKAFLEALEVLFAGEKYVPTMAIKQLQKAYGDPREGIFRRWVGVISCIFRGKWHKIKEYRYARRQIQKYIAGRMAYNHQFIQKEKQKKYEMGGFLLDKQQIEAVVACEDACLVLAPAGSGKTASLLAKVQYLVQGLGMDPRRILLISFTKKVEYELKDRSKIKDVEIRTFHSLGNKILRQSDRDGKRQMLEEGMMKKFLLRELRQLSLTQKNFARALHDFLLFDYTRSNFDERFLTDQDRQIAIWLKIHGLEYNYRKQYPYLETNYKPDFTVQTEAGQIYLEFYDIDNNGDNLKGGRIKQQGWRHKIHHAHQTHLLEMYAYEWTDDWRQKLQQKFEKFGVQIRRLPEKQIAQIIKTDQRATADLGALKKMFAQILVLQKNNMMTIEDFSTKISKIKEQLERQRAERFLEIYRPLNLGYQRYLAENQRFDFADMINEAIDIVRSQPKRTFPYDYILVDEVQDLSLNRYQLVKALLDKNPEARLFAVGDDWQAIYRFAGSDLSLIENFEQVFGKETYRSMIELTHRFGQPTINLSGDFVQKNPMQSHKQVRGSLKTKTPIEIILNKKRGRRGEAIDYDNLNKLFNYLQSKGKLQGKSIQIIARHNRDIERVLGRNETGKLKKVNKCVQITKQENGLVTDLKWKLDDGEKIPISFCSIHKAKGITRDIVIVINMDGDPSGMPATRKNDPVVELLLATSEKYPLAEERRLFYVAITRARELTVLIGDEWNKSPFLTEVQDMIDRLDGA